MWCRWWSTWSSLILENVTEIKVSKPIQDNKRKQHVCCQQVFWATSWTILWFTVKTPLFDTPYDKSLQLRKGKGSLSQYPVCDSRDCKCYFFPLQINGKNISWDHAKNLTFKMFSAFQKWTCLPSFLWPLSRCQVFRTTYWVKKAEQRGGGGSKI